METCSINSITPSKIGSQAGDASSKPISPNTSSSLAPSSKEVGQEFFSAVLIPFKLLAKAVSWIFRTLFCCCAGTKLKEQELKDMIKLVFTFYCPRIFDFGMETDLTALNALAKNIALNPNIESYVIESFANKKGKKFFKKGFEDIRNNRLEGSLHQLKEKINGFAELILGVLKNNFNHIGQSQNTTLVAALQGMLLLCTEFAVHRQGGATKEAFAIFRKLQSNPEAKKELLDFVNEYGWKKCKMSVQDEVLFRKSLHEENIKSIPLQFSIKKACAEYLKHLFVPGNS